MKKLIFILVTMCLLPIFVNGQFTYNVTVKAPSLNGSKVVFCLLDNNNQKAIRKDILTFKNGIIQLKGILGQPCNFASFSTVYKGKTLYVDFVLDSGKRSIELAIAVLNKNTTLKLDGLNTVSNKIRNQAVSLFYERLDAYRKSSGKATAAFIPDSLNRLFLVERMRLLEKYPDEYYSLIDLYQLSRFDRSVEYQNLILNSINKFGKQLKEYPLAKQIYQDGTGLIRNINAAKTGNRATAFQVMDENGKIFDSNSLSGHKYIIAFSATWCIPCQEQLPMLQKVYEQYKSKGLKVVYFNDDDNVDKWKNHIKLHKLNWINVSERLKAGKGRIQHSYGVYAIPVYIIVDEKGKIVYNSNDNDPGLDKFEENVYKLFEGEK